MRTFRQKNIKQVKVNVQTVITQDLHQDVTADPVKIFFDIAYWLGVCPFKLKLAGPSYIAVTWIPHQVISHIQIRKYVCINELNLNVICFGFFGRYFLWF